jgi:hypothetical protein
MGQANRPTFEVASIKRSAGDGFPDAKPRRSGDRVTMHNIRVATAIIYAYHLADRAMTTSNQLAGNEMTLWCATRTLLRSTSRNPRLAADIAVQA